MDDSVLEVAAGSVVPFLESVGAGKDGGGGYETAEGEDGGECGFGELHFDWWISEWESMICSAARRNG